MATLAKYYAEIGVKGLSGVQGAFASVRKGIAGLASATTAPIRKIGSMFTGLASPVGLFGAALGAAGVAGGAGILKIASDMESLETQFRVLLGSGEAAKAMLDDINRFAASTPFEQMELGAAAKQLLAYGVASQNIIPTMRQLGDIAALSGAPLQDLVSIFGKIKGQGKLTAETLQQFSDRAIPVARQLAEQFGVSEAQIRQMVSEGKIGFADVQAALTALTSEGGQFAGGMAQLAQTTSGLWSTITGNFKTLLGNFGTAIIEAFNLKQVMADLGTWLGSAAENFAAFAAPVVERIRSIVTSIGAWISGVWAEWGGVVMQYFSTVAAVFTAIYQAVASVFSAVSQFIQQTVGVWIQQLMGFFGASGGSLAEWVQGWLTEIEFLATNWRLYIQILLERFLLFVRNVPAYFQAAVQNLVILIQWFARNWKDIFVTIVRFTYTVFTKLVENLKGLWDSFWNWIKGGDFEVNWTPLTEGFESAIKEMPQLVAANVEQSTPALDKMTAELEKRRREFLAGKQAKNKGKEADKGTPEGTPNVPPPSRQTAPEAPTAPTGPGKPDVGAGAAGGGGRAGPGIGFTGLADLAKQMQEEAGKRLQERMAKAGEATAEATNRVAVAVAGDRMRVEIVKQPAAVFAP
ncbi:MAG: hypothetical protein Kow0040_14730 [Thermogutta sp.]